MTPIRKPTIVVLGMAAKKPVAGVIWQTVHYLLGFERLGYEVHYVEAHATTPTSLMRRPDDDGGALAAAFIARMMGRFGLGGRWAFHALHADGRCYGVSIAELMRLYRSADLIVNLHGGTMPRPEHRTGAPLIFLETDPVRVQIELACGDRSAIEHLEPHDAFFTFGENYGGPDCGLPVSDRFHFRTTRQPVLLDLWRRPGPPPDGHLRTIGNWQQGGDIRFDGSTYSWSKHHEFLRVIQLPRLTRQGFELALAKAPEPDRRLLEENGWNVTDALAFSHDADAYRSFIHASRGEFSVAKDQNVRLRSGWFSDRSATFLASGLPVVLQDTGFGCALPTGEGLFAFRTAEDAAAAVEAINRDPRRHGRAARELAREYFGHEVVLGRLLAELGMPVRPRPTRRSAAGSATLPASLVIMPVSRHPTELDPATLAALGRRPMPGRRRRAPAPTAERPTASTVVVTRDNLALTRMCLETVLDTIAAHDELIVVDNASATVTRDYLARLGAGDGRVRTILNGTNRSFSASVNQGLAAAAGALLVILNNDVIVTPGWLDGLARHLEDPGLGLVGPVTNEAGNEAEVEVDYRTYGELLRFARDRAERHVGQATPMPVATMFCAAMRREVHDRVGPLDEGYRVGMFEDDDYSLRVRRTGLRVECAEDVFVHHFGKGSFGALVPGGAYGAAFEANRRRFERKWGCRWTPHLRRSSDGWMRTVSGTRGLVRDHLPVDAVVLIVSRGDDSMLEDLGERTGWHFPREHSGRYAGHYPADGHEAIQLLERLRDEGATHLLVPRPEMWWLDHYGDLRDHLESRHRRIADTRAGVAYELAGSLPEARTS